MTAQSLDDELSKEFVKYVKPLLAINDKLRKLTKLEDDINTSTIVAVGDQSHGKSSVIEALSGVLLPRGQGMKTKLPLSLHLRSAEEEKAIIQFAGRKDREVSLADVAKAIDELTAEVVGEGVADVKDEEIDLTVFRPGQVDLDLIDLPGMTRATGESGPADLETRIKDMYCHYMRPPEAVLLNVVAAQTDTGNSTGFKMSIDFDAHRKRTLLCYTKMDSYSDNPKHFVERVKRDLEAFTLDPHDVFCVRNRSQAESENGLSLEDAREKESKCLADPEGPALAANEQLKVGLGRAGLAQRLAYIQRKRIAEALPELMKALNKRLLNLQQVLDDLPKIYLTEADCVVELQKCLSNIRLGLKSSREGRVKANPSFIVLSLELGASTPKNEEEKDGRWVVSAHWDFRSAGAKEMHDQKVKQRMEHAGLGRYSEELLRRANDNVTCRTLDEMGVRNYHKQREILDILEENDNAEIDEDLLIVSVRDKKESNFSYEVQVTPKAASSSIRSSDEIEPGYLAEFSYPSPCAVDIKTIIRVGQQGVPFTSCSSFARSKDKFVEAVRTNKPRTFFFSKTFFNTMKDCYEQYRGCEGLPGTLPSHVAVDVARELQKDIYPFADEFADHVQRDVVKWTEEEALAHLGSFPLLYEKASEAIRRVLTSARLHLGEDLMTTRRCFDQVMLEDHYFSFVLKDIRDKVTEVRRGERELGFLTQEIVERMDNHDSGIVDDISRLAAYWKVMCKEYSGYVTKLVKVHLLSQKTDDDVMAAISGDCFSGNTLVQQMAPSQKQRQARVALEQRINNLRDAKNEYEHAKNSQLLFE